MLSITSRALVLMFAAIVTATPAAALNLMVELGQDEVQQKVTRMFPVSFEGPFFTLGLRHPQVVLKEGSERIGLRLDAAAELLGAPALSGSALVEGAPRLDSARDAIFLDNAAVAQLHLDGVAPEYLPDLQHAADALIRAALRTQPIYVLGQPGDPPLLKRKDLKAIRVQNGKLIIELAMP